MPNPHAFTFSIVALAAALSLLIVSLSAERFARAWRTLWPLGAGSSAANTVRRVAGAISSALASASGSLPAEFGGICAARATEAITEGAPDGLKVRCPAHGTEIGKPCLSESDMPIDPAWVSTSTETSPKPQVAPLPPNEPAVPVELHQLRAYSEEPGAKRARVVGHDPSRHDCWHLEIVPAEGTDPGTIAATVESRRRWQTVEDVQMFLPHVVPTETKAEEPTIAIEPGENEIDPPSSAPEATS